MNRRPSASHSPSHMPELFVLKDGRVPLYVTGKGIKSFLSSDECATWTEESGTRLSAQGNIAADPSVLRLPDGTYWMAWKCINPEMMNMQGTPPKPTP